MLGLAEGKEVSLEVDRENLSVARGELDIQAIVGWLKTNTRLPR